MNYPCLRNAVFQHKGLRHPGAAQSVSTQGHCSDYTTTLSQWPVPFNSCRIIAADHRCAFGIRSADCVRGLLQ